MNIKNNRRVSGERICPRPDVKSESDKEEFGLIPIVGIGKTCDKRGFAVNVLINLVL